MVRDWYRRNPVAGVLFLLALMIMGAVAGSSAVQGEWTWFWFSTAAVMLFLAIDVFVIMTGIRLERQLSGTRPPDELLG